jgi:hypothetical protein
LLKENNELDWELLLFLLLSFHTIPWFIILFTFLVLNSIIENSLRRWIGFWFFVPHINIRCKFYSIHNLWVWTMIHIWKCLFKIEF